MESVCDASVPGVLRIRDGLPILDSTGSSFVQGSVIRFKQGRYSEGYQRINALEPDKQYRWSTTEVMNSPCNYLEGLSPEKGSVLADDPWNGREDPLFTAALEVVQDTLRQNQSFDWNLKPMFHLQMAYLLLWTSIERYCSLRYHLRDQAAAKIRHISDDPEFVELLKKHVQRQDRVQRADRPREHYSLDPNNARTSLDYYYQVRSNIAHRGKGALVDHQRVEQSLVELLPIFEGLLANAFAESCQSDAGMTFVQTARSLE